MYVHIRDAENRVRKSNRKNSRKRKYRKGQEFKKNTSESFPVCIWHGSTYWRNTLRKTKTDYAGQTKPFCELPEVFLNFSIYVLHVFFSDLSTSNNFGGTLKCHFLLF